jgi:hypothetical protein
MIKRGLSLTGWHALSFKRRACWTALLCLALAPARGARSFAADPPPAKAATAPAAKKAAPAANPKGAAMSLIFTPAPAANNAAPAAKKAAPPRAQPAARRGSLLGAIVNALGGDDLAAEKQREAAQRQQEAAMDQNVRNLEAQFRPQFEQLLYTELAFLRRSCKPDAKPFVEVAKAAKAELHVPLREYVVAQYMPQMRVRRAGQADDTIENPRVAMQKLLMPLAEAKLGREKARLYRVEFGKREEERKHAVIMSLVAALDERLVLTSAQRAKLVESLSPKYEDSWESYCQMFAFNGQYMPSIPNQAVAPLLDERQKGAWREMSSLNGRVRFGISINGNMQFGQATEVQEIARMVEEVKDGP